MTPTLTNLYTPLRVLLVAGSPAQASTLSDALSQLQPAGVLTTCTRAKRAVQEYQRNPCDVVLVAGHARTRRTVLTGLFALAHRRGSFLYGGQFAPGGHITWYADADAKEPATAWAVDTEGSLAGKLRSIQALRQLWLGYSETSRFQLAMLENIREGALLLDADDNVLHANRIAEHMLRAPHGSLVGQRAPDLFAPTSNHPQLRMSVPPVAVPGRPDWRFVMFRNGIAPSPPDEIPLLLQDVLTGLPTHLLMQDRLNKAVHLAARYSRNVGLLCIAVDEMALAELNDTHGPTAGDLVLRELANRLMASVRLVDTVARSKTGHFVAILQELSRPEDAPLVARRMLAACQAPVLLKDNLPVNVPVYMGIASFPEHGKTSTELFTRAEAALTHAQASQVTGAGAAVCTYRADFDLQADRALLEQQLLSVLDDHEMLMYYQPKLSVATNQVVGVEALVRWNCNGAVRGPDKLIALAEELNLIGRITQQAVRDSIRQAAAWRRGGHDIPVAVNVPPGEFSDSLLQLVSAVLREFDLPPRLLEIEITESALGLQNADAPRVMQALAAMGVRLSLDDFGTGYSSLDRLKSFPLDTLKIDRGFIRAIQGAQLVNGELQCPVDVHKDVAILRAIVSLAKNLQLQIVAEGVEVAEQLEVLRALEVDCWQGYHASPALPAHEFAVWHAVWTQTADTELAINQL